ncbi:hypothetical protein KCP71_09295 [Salmonella enterica subsp. enterica]|nr:hypothetical protein KCP71_09295 [Salmonella enterica subsp. enterica]
MGLMNSGAGRHHAAAGEPAAVAGDSEEVRAVVAAADWSAGCSPTSRKWAWRRPRWKVRWRITRRRAAGGDCRES